MLFRRTNKNQQENKITHTTSTRVSDYWNHLGMNKLHKTTFTPLVSATLFVLILLFGHLFGNLVALITMLFTHSHVPAVVTPAKLQTLVYVVVEALPILCTLWLYTNRDHLQYWLAKMYINHKHLRFQFIKKYVAKYHNESSRPSHWKIISPIINWLKIFYQAIKKYYKLILLLFVIVDGANLITKAIFTLIAGPNLAMPTTVTLLELAKKDWLLIPALIFIVPVFEELIFRVFIPNIIAGCFNVINKGQYMFVKYWSAAILAGLIFAKVHSVSGSNWGIMFSLFVYAILQQIIYKKSKSIIAPICVHSLTNILYVIVMLIPV